MERRRELALMQAIGFAPVRIGALLTIETALLLILGLAIGSGCSVIAVVPYAMEMGPGLSIFSPLLMLGLVLASGILAAAISAGLVLRMPILDRLRNQ